MDHTHWNGRAGYPHAPHCHGCRAESRCNICGRHTGRACRNGRCLECHHGCCVGHKHTPGKMKKAIAARRARRS